MDEQKYFEKKKDELLEASGLGESTLTEYFREKAYGDGVEGYLDFLADLTQLALEPTANKEG